MIVLSALMEKILVVGAILFLSSSANVRAAEQAPAATEMSIRDQIKAARAKDVLEEKSASVARSWDRDASGKRPWDTAKPTEPVKR
ncbi:hypothetical protein [Bradyrhizobium sp. CCGUVB14]|uniref:hypothetical protein n=1 Tax=Bradyrhizobium sp. CCGUVB14 TaxID=2949628 RepID=UPI0020B2A88F|nr:hypothetical protein [Bradyrhizobium sp. CCGUVB14]MCP3440632.1 hypothetical protein [Bradyrhizobium sp. CCGUVB14]